MATIAKILIIETVTASIHANNGNIIIMPMPISTKLRHPHHEPFSSRFSFVACLEFLIQM